MHERLHLRRCQLHLERIPVAQRRVALEDALLYEGDGTPVPVSVMRCRFQGEMVLLLGGLVAAIRLRQQAILNQTADKHWALSCSIHQDAMCRDV